MNLATLAAVIYAIYQWAQKYPLTQELTDLFAILKQFFPQPAPPAPAPGPLGAKMLTVGSFTCTHDELFAELGKMGLNGAIISAILAFVSANEAWLIPLLESLFHIGPAPVPTP